MKQTLYLAFALVVLHFSSSAVAQTTIKGHVVDERGKSVEYVSIGFEEDSVGVISDAQGYFEISIPANRYRASLSMDLKEWEHQLLHTTVLVMNLLQFTATFMSQIS